MTSAATPPFSLKRIDHVLLLVGDMESALQFYEQILGARVESRLPAYAMVELRAGDSNLDLVDTSAPGGTWALPQIAGGRNVDHIALRIEAASEAALREYLTASGVAIVEERAEEGPDGSTHSFYVRDPAGNLIELLMARSL